MNFALAGVSDTFGDMLLPVIDAIAPKLQQFAEWAQKNPELLKKIVIAVAAFTAGIVALNIALSLNPIVLIAIGIGLLIGLLVTAYNRFEGFRKVVDSVFGVIKFGVEKVALPAINLLLNTFKFVFNLIGKLWNNTFGKISFKIPNIPGLPGRGTKVEFPKIPALADGGIVTGPTLALIGEAGPEAVVPLDRMGGMGGGINITVHAGLVSTPDQIGQEIIQAIQKAQRRSGPVFAPA
jgi:hypothetical protein